VKQKEIGKDKRSDTHEVKRKEKERNKYYSYIIKSRKHKVDFLTILRNCEVYPTSLDSTILN